jgi:hypothetical protein
MILGFSKLCIQMFQSNRHCKFFFFLFFVFMHSCWLCFYILFFKILISFIFIFTTGLIVVFFRWNSWRIGSHISTCALFFQATISWISGFSMPLSCISTLKMIRILAWWHNSIGRCFCHTYLLMFFCFYVCFFLRANYI